VGRDSGRGLRRVGARIAGTDVRWGRTRTRGGAGRGRAVGGGRTMVHGL
jgi:hypothetical protein